MYLEDFYVYITQSITPATFGEEMSYVAKFLSEIA